MAIENISLVKAHPLDECRLLGSIPFKGGAIIEVREVTPSAAAELTTARWNSHNRKMSDRFVTAYTEDRKMGAWEITPNGFAFDSEGIVLDGQKRLRSIALAGKASIEFVLRNVPTKAQRAMDRNQRRTHGNDEQIAKRSMPNERASWVRMLHVVPDGGSGTISVAKRDSLVRKYQRDIEWAAKNATPALKRAPVMGALIMAHHRYPKETEAFYEQLRSGENLRQGYPALTLRDYLSRVPQLRPREHQIACKVLRAAQAYICGERITRLEFTTAPLVFFGLRSSDSGST